MRKRLSLIEAFNNSIFATNNEIDETDRYLNEFNLSSKFYVSDSRTLENDIQVFSMRDILRRVNKSNYSVQNKDVEVPLNITNGSISLTKNQMQSIRDRRSRSHPVQEHDVEKFAYVSANHISRIDSQVLYCNGNTNLSVDANGNESCCNSIHSANSSILTSSAVSSCNVDQSLLTAEAIWDHVAILPDELPFASGDIISVYDYSSHSQLWFGSSVDRTGWFPSSYVRVLNGNGSDQINNSSTPFSQSTRILRRRVIEELITTEHDYVQLLQNLVEGFVLQTRRRSELFKPASIQRLFSNIEAIHSMHRKFFIDLEQSVNKFEPEDSLIGDVFLRNRVGFMIYSEYCNNRPISSAELAILNELPHYHHFFEACRMLKGMPKLSLEAFLLTPVQRICKYPLQLTELLKATPPSHSDREAVQKAVSTMKGIAAMINEKKRRIECLQKLAIWQKSVEGWRGPDVFETNCELIRSGEASCRCLADGELLWHKDVLLFLFDQTVIICKKDLIRRNHYLFKDRISLYSAKFIDCFDGRDNRLCLTLKNVWMLVAENKEFIFSCKDKIDKEGWIQQMRKKFECSPPTPEERRLVRETLRHTICAKSETLPTWNMKNYGRFSWKKKQTNNYLSQQQRF